MDENPQPLNGEATPSDTGTEEVAVTDAETSEVGTLDQPAEETTGDEPKPSRAQARISEVVAEKNYWKDLALQSAPLEEKSAPTDESEGVGIDDIAKAVVRELEGKENSKRVEAAQKAAFQDALQAAAEFPELDSDERLSRRVLAIAQADGISITEAAREYLGQTKTQARKTAESATRATVAAPTAQGVNTGTVAPVDLNSLSEDEKAANWARIVSNMAGEE